MDSKRLMIVDDHQLISAGLSSLLKHMDYVVETTECNSGREALRVLEESTSFDLLLLDINMPSFDGFDLLQSIKARKLNIPAAMISASSDIQQIQKSIDAGAIGFLPKDCSPNLMLTGIDKLLAGHRYLPPHLEKYVFFDRAANDREYGILANGNSVAVASGPLKPREKEVLKLLMHGKSNKAIATILSISESTVKFHVSKLFQKLNARSRTECISIATQRNLLGP